MQDIQYNWNGEGFQASDSYAADAALGDSALSLSVKVNDGTTDYTIDLEPVNFIWQGASIN